MAEYTTSTKYNIVQCLYSRQNKRVTGALPSRVTAHTRSHIHTHTHTLTHKDQPPYVGTRHRCHWVPTEVTVSQHDGGGGDSGGLSKVGVRWDAHDLDRNLFEPILPCPRYILLSFHLSPCHLVAFLSKEPVELR